MHLLIVHQYYKRDGVVGGSRWNEMARFWRQMGHEVTVIAGMFDPGTGTNYPEYRGKVIVSEKSKYDISVIRVYTPPNYDKNYFWRMLSYVSFAFFGVLAVFSNKLKLDVIIASSPPLTVGPTGAMISLLKRVPLIFEVRDLWPESAIDIGVVRNQLIIRVLYLMEAISYRVATRINALTPAFRDVIITKKGVAGQRVWMIPNGADTDLIYPGIKENEVRKRHGWNGKFVGLYTGAHGRANHLWQLIEAASLLRDEPEFILACVGNGMERASLIAERVRCGLVNIQFLDAVTKSEIGLYLNACDVAVIVLKKVDTFKTVYPNKMFDAMSAAKPIILGIDGVARELVVDQARCGTFVEPENAEQIAEAMRGYRAAPDRLSSEGNNGYEYVKKYFTRKHLAEKYVSFIEDEIVHNQS